MHVSRINLTRTKRGSITLETVFCIEAVEDALARHGKGAWRVNVFIERLWRTIKYEVVYYLHGYANLPGCARVNRALHRL